MSSWSKWVRPEVYPLLGAMGVVLGLCSYQLYRNITTNPEVRVTKQGRRAGILDNFEEGEHYAEHPARKYLRNRRPEVMPSINAYFSKPDVPS